jgi:Flp pilus assembly protein TadD
VILIHGRRAALVAVLAACSAFFHQPALADPTEEQPSEGVRDPDYAAGLKAIEGKNWPEAIRLLSSAALRDTRNADIQNFLAYSYRNSGDVSLAFRHYHRALELNPRHRGAHEYIGEAYLMIGNPAKAEEHLKALDRICLIPCEEREHLLAKLAQYKQAASK